MTNDMRARSALPRRLLVAAMLAVFGFVSCGTVPPVQANGQSGVPVESGAGRAETSDEVSQVEGDPRDGAEPLDHAEWDRLLKRYVDDEGNVAYRDLGSNAADRSALDAYLDRIATADPESMGRDDSLAFHINAYNACIVKGVLDGRTAESLLGRARFFKIHKCTVAGQEMTLDYLEQKIIRPRFKEARIHFALVCASASCPQLNRDAWTAPKLEQMLDRAGRQFLADAYRNPLGDGSKIRVSSLFDWYRDDFVDAAGSLEAFLARYAPGDAPGCLSQGPCQIDFVDYDWTLNAQEGQRPGDGGDR